MPMPTGKPMTLVGLALLLVLLRASPVDSSGWHMGQEAESCTRLCKAVGGECNATQMNLVRSQQALQVVIAAAVSNSGTPPIDCINGYEGVHDREDVPMVHLHMPTLCYYNANRSKATTCDAADTTRVMQRLCCCTKPGETATTVCPTANTTAAASGGTEVQLQLRQGTSASVPRYSPKERAVALQSALSLASEPNVGVPISVTPNAIAASDGSLLQFWMPTHVIGNNETGEAAVKGPHGHLDHDFVPAATGKHALDCRLLADNSLTGNVTWKIYVSPHQTC